MITETAWRQFVQDQEARLNDAALDIAGRLRTYALQTRDDSTQIALATLVQRAALRDLPDALRLLADAIDLVANLDVRR